MYQLHMWDLRDLCGGTGRESAERPDEWMSPMQHELWRFQAVPARRQMRLLEIEVRTHWTTVKHDYTFADCSSTVTRNAAELFEPGVLTSPTPLCSHSRRVHIDVEPHQRHFGTSGSSEPGTRYTTSFDATPCHDKATMLPLTTPHSTILPRPSTNPNNDINNPIPDSPSLPSIGHEHLRLGHGSICLFPRRRSGIISLAPPS
jgi:hypothetical protein